MFRIRPIGLTSSSRLIRAIPHSIANTSDGSGPFASACGTCVGRRGVNGCVVVGLDRHPCARRPAAVTILVSRVFATGPGVNPPVPCLGRLRWSVGSENQPEKKAVALNVRSLRAIAAARAQHRRLWCSLTWPNAITEASRTPILPSEASECSRRCSNRARPIANRPPLLLQRIQQNKLSDFELAHFRP